MNTKSIKYFFQEIKNQTLKDLEQKRKVLFYTGIFYTVIGTLLLICGVLYSVGVLYYGKEEFEKIILPFYENYFAPIVTWIQSLLSTLSEWASIPFQWALCIFIILLIGGSAALYLWLQSRYVNTFKNRINKKLFQQLNPGIKYSPEEHISKKDFENSGLFTPNCSYTGNDHCSGIIVDHPLEFSEMQAYIMRSAGQYSASKSVLFHGLFLKLSLPSSMEGIYIVPKKTDVGVLSLKGRKINSFKGKKKWNSQTDFDQQFNIYCDNISQAQLFLTEDRKNNILNIYTRFNKNIYLSIKNSYLYLAIECGAFFEPPVKKAIRIEEIEKSAEFFISFINAVSSVLIPSFCKE